MLFKCELMAVNSQSGFFRSYRIKLLSGIRKKNRLRKTRFHSWIIAFAWKSGTSENTVFNEKHLETYWFIKKLSFKCLFRKECPFGLICYRK